jgi:GTP-binding protein
MALPKVVIVGRPNVGKSSLFNWIAGRRIAIVDDVSGVTRDRVSTLASIGDGPEARFFELIDTGGVGIVDRDDLSDEVEHQIEIAMNDASVILFVVDVRDGRMPLDEEVASRLRYLNTPVILVINKADTEEFEQRDDDYYKFGRGKPVYVSTHQNRNKNQLLKMIGERLPDTDTFKPADEVMKIAVVGRPNTGKSTFINTLAHSERMIVSERPGTTRDSVDVRFELDGLPFLAIDTAGVKRKAKIRDNLEFYSIHRAERSIRRADVTFLFIDPTQGISKLDKQLADYIAKQYKPCIFVINKWDLIATDPTADMRGSMTKLANGVQFAFRNMAYMPLAFITAKTGKNVKALLNLAQSMYKQANKRVGTSVLNKILREAVEAHPPSSRERTPRIYYATQVGVAPPTVVLFVNSPTLFDATYQRYLLNIFREKLPYGDIPIKLYLRARSQTDPNAPRRDRSDPTDDIGSLLESDEHEHMAAYGHAPDDSEINELMGELED